MTHPIEAIIARADAAIVKEDFDALMDVYCDDAVLVVKPGMNATGKAQIRRAFEAIAAHFNHSVQVGQAELKILEAGDTALALARTVVSASNVPAFSRDATYVFRKDTSGRWRCAIDNSYGHELLWQGEAPDAVSP
jgi:uncharacterized protein (TIGR02246 family)